MTDRRVWLKSGEYLPSFLRDFHDQKDLFKTIHERYKLDEPKDHRDPINWVQAHIYAVDHFLWFMADHGYTLQRSRKQVPFPDIHATLAHHKQIREDHYTALLKEALSAKPSERSP